MPRTTQHSAVTRSYCSWIISSEKSVEQKKALFSSSSSAIMAEIQTISLAGPSSAASTASSSLSSAPLPVPALKQTDYSNITKVKNEPTATNRPLQRSAPSPPHALDSKRKKLDVVEDPMANPQEGDERVKETVMEGPLKVLLEDPIANPPDNNEHVKEMARKGLSEVLVVKDPLSARGCEAPGTRFQTIGDYLDSISYHQILHAHTRACYRCHTFELGQHHPPVTPAGTNTTTDAATSSGGTKPLSPAPRSVKTVENETVTKDRKASCRDGNNAKSICKQLLDTKQSGGMESAFARHWEALCTSGGDKAFIDQANAK
ncbi:hypothetical protein LshimejAT787_0700980 [Lyophyllum shimeji]|uniref:Uncharacterized protein n=1 Tax=Lyophyllum shimeji TaxID=47721 RepID=A0A9P3PQ86_LYOSH|nr:hypothetical protein LshimejAT787_0700980 [Lyophyllum shimeji]